MLAAPAPGQDAPTSEPASSAQAPAPQAADSPSLRLQVGGLHLFDTDIDDGGEISVNRFSTRIDGTCLKHYMAGSGIKMYDKFGRILRLEAVTNDVTFFQHYRRVEHRDGTWEMKQAPMRKTIYSLPALAKALGAANHRYLEFLSAVDDPTNEIRGVQQVSRRVQEKGRSYKGFNLFDEVDLKLYRILSRGEFNLRGLRSRDLRRHLGAKSPG